MGTKLLQLARLMYIMAVLLLFLSYIFSGEVVEKVLLWVSMFGVVFYLYPMVYEKKETHTKMLYATILFWGLSRLSNVYNLEGAFVVFSCFTTFTALWVTINGVIYVNKYCKRDTEEYLDKL